MPKYDMILFPNLAPKFLAKNYVFLLTTLTCGLL